MAIRVTDPIGGTVTIAFVAGFTHIHDPVSAFLGRRAVVVAQIENKHSSAVHFAVDDVAIVADLALVDEPVTADTIGGESKITSPPKLAVTKYIQPLVLIGTYQDPSRKRILLFTSVRFTISPQVTR
ncbi:MAG TPA: hypothetical protein VN253_24905 [Kofleriaceae bacterium]|nr:hypothetical protein [Kofleriaceae bacterium]